MPNPKVLHWKRAKSRKSAARIHRRATGAVRDGPPCPVCRQPTQGGLAALMGRPLERYEYGWCPECEVAAAPIVR